MATKNSHDHHYCHHHLSETQREQREQQEQEQQEEEGQQLQKEQQPMQLRQRTKNPHHSSSPHAAQGPDSRVSDTHRPLNDVRRLSQELTAPSSPTTEHCAADAKRAMSHTKAWRPVMRRQSWDKEEHKHTLQMTGIIREVKTGFGFSEKG
ncbi:hypothetical protein VTK73DRAFT_10353 [Phialemonium thermophilum]|uniref:Uncharacterized protein n=1 Tax=Phialemonium thermophilum TaxID=223376 RepID=A0ABR3XGS5_9PEZI